MKKVIRWVLILALIALVIIQFIRPEKNSGGYESVITFENETKPSVAVAEILKTNCYDCHSNHTQYPWYSEIAPISYFLKDHIDEGKEHFNVSAWDSYSIKKKDHKHAYAYAHKIKPTLDLLGLNVAFEEILQEQSEWYRSFRRYNQFQHLAATDESHR